MCIKGMLVEFAGAGVMCMKVGDGARKHRGIIARIEHDKRFGRIWLQTRCTYLVVIAYPDVEHPILCADLIDVMVQGIR